MKIFKWRLQRLLDVRGKQEDALRTELVSLTEQTGALRGRILMEKAMLRSRLDDLRQKDASDRLGQQRDFMQDVSVVDTRIAVLQKELNELDQKRKEKIESIMAVRKFRKTLERLRTQALITYQGELNRQEQNSQDESTNAAFARKVLEPSR